MARNENSRNRWNKILDILARQATPLDLTELKKKLAAEKFAVSLPTLRNDIRALIDNHAPLERSHGTVLYKPYAKTEFEKRSAEMKREKEQIADVASALLFGEEETRQHVLEFVQKKIGWQGFPVRQLLQAMWQKSSRIVTLDASTTNVAIAESIRGRTFPSHTCSDISVITNSPSIVDVLYKNESVRTVLIGGEMRRERYSVVGHLADRCVEAFNFVSDMSFIGSTGVDSQRGFTSDDVMETHLKMRFLDLSRIRCVVVDHSKILRPSGAYSVFLGFSPKQVDFVIMDDKVMERQLPPDEKEAIGRFVAQIEDANICLLTRVRLGLARAKIK